MLFPGGSQLSNGSYPNISFEFGTGPFSHGLNPFDLKSTANVITTNQITCGWNWSDSTGVDSYNAWNAKIASHKSPLIMAGWGYDLFGRPMPNLRKTLKTMNGSNAYDDTSYATSSNFFDDGRDNIYNMDGAVGFPHGGHAASQYYVGGALDVRYDARHGIWNTNHFVLAEILGYVDRDAADWSVYTREYEWREVEMSDQFLDDPLRRERGYYCGEWCCPDPLDYPARSYRYNDGEDIDVLNPAINLSEFGYNTSHGPRPLIGPPVPSGSIVQLRSVNSIYYDQNSNNPFAGAYVFSFEVPNKFFVEITYSEALDLALDAAGNQGLGACAGTEEIGTFEYPTTRWMYYGVIKKWVGSAAGSLGGHPRHAYWGKFETDESFLNYNNPFYDPTTGGMVRMINTIEYNNTLSNVGRDEFNHPVSPGINMGSGTDYPEGFSIRPISSGTIVEATYMPNQYMHDEATLDCMSDDTHWEYPYPMAYFQLANAHGGGCASGAATPGQNLGNPICADVCVDGDGYDLHGYGCWRWPTPGGNCIPGIAADYTAQGRGRTLPPS